MDSAGIMRQIQAISQTEKGGIAMFEHCKPEELNVDSRGIIRFLDEMKEQKLHLHNLMILRHGKVICETSFAPWSKDKKHMLFSLTKSFTSTAMGFAVQDGLLSLDDKVIDFFPEMFTNPPCENMQKMKVKNVLTMNTGHSIEPRMQGENWERNFLHSYVDHEPGTHFIYNTTGTYMLSAIIQRATGKKTLDYLREKLFVPLGMSDDIWAEESPTGVMTGGHGLNVRIEDIAKLGQFLLQKGKWNGKQLLNEQWIKDAQTPWSDNSHWTGGPDWNSGYGYQFWMCSAKNVFRGDGACGQFCVVCPDQDMVIAINSGVQDMAAILRSIWDNVLPGVDQAGDGDSDALAERLKATDTPADWEDNGEEASAPAVEKDWVGKYRLNKDNALGLDMFEMAEDCAYFYDTTGRKSRIPLCLDTWQHILLKPEGNNEESYRSAAAVRAARVGGDLVIHLCYTNTPFEDILRISFSEHGLVIDNKKNVGRGSEIIGYKL